jgi:UDP-xylose/UDP-N-acetylglucosamine transporter B4
MINDTNAVKGRPDTYATAQVGRSPGGANGHVNGSTTIQLAKAKQDTGVMAAVAHATVPSWANMILMASLIFGGCCTNVSSW